MAILDFFKSGAAEEATPAGQSALVDIFNEAYKPTQSPVMPGSSQDAPVLPSIETQTVTEQSPQGVTEVSETSEEPGFLDKLAGAFTDPAFLSAAMAFGDSMAGNAQGFSQNMNTFAQRMQDKRDKIREDLANQKAEKRYEEETAYKRAQDEAARNFQLTKYATPESLAKFNETGNYADLVERPEEMTEYQRQSLDLQRANHADSMAMQRARLAQAQSSGAGSMGGTGNSVADSDMSKYGAIQAEDGQWVKPKFYRGQIVGYEPVGVQLSKELTARKSKDGLSANEALTFDNIQKGIDLTNDPEATSGLTAPGTMGNAIKQFLPAGAQNFVGGFANDKTRQLNTIADQVDGQLQNIGIQMAKEGGASGINTLPEVKQYASSLPWIDRSSPERTRETLKAAQIYLAEHAKSSRSAKQDAVVPGPIADKGAAKASSGDWSIKKL